MKRPVPPFVPSSRETLGPILRRVRNSVQDVLSWMDSGDAILSRPSVDARAFDSVAIEYDGFGMRTTARGLLEAVAPVLWAESDIATTGSLQTVWTAQLGPGTYLLDIRLFPSGTVADNHRPRISFGGTADRYVAHTVWTTSGGVADLYRQDVLGTDWSTMTLTGGGSGAGMTSGTIRVLEAGVLRLAVTQHSGGIIRRGSSMTIRKVA